MKIHPKGQSWVDEARTLHRGRQIVENIENESRLEEKQDVVELFWDRLSKLFEELTAHQPRDIEGKRAYKSLCLIELAVTGADGENDLYLNGQEAEYTEDTFGRIERIYPNFIERFDFRLRQKCAVQPGNQDAVVKFLVSKRPHIRSIQMGRPGRITWAFFPADLDVEGIGINKALATAGLKEEYEPYIYWEYDGSNISAHCPTVLDAGNEPRFMPTDSGRKTGLTCPTQDDLDGVREVVHRAEEVNIKGYTVMKYEQRRDRQ